MRVLEYRPIPLRRLAKGLAMSDWFSEGDLPLGRQLLREIDKGLRKARFEIVLGWAEHAADLLAVQHRALRPLSPDALLERAP